MGSKYTSPLLLLPNSGTFELNRQSQAWYLLKDDMPIMFLNNEDYPAFIEWMIKSYNEYEGTDYKLSEQPKP